MKELSELLLMILATATLLLTGCGGPGTGAILPERRILADEHETYEAPEDATHSDSAVQECPRPQGDLTLREALRLSLLHNPRLRVFAWEIRAAEARQLQADLPPNPEFEVEIEEIGGTGGRSRFSGTETAIQLSQVVELGDKRSRRDQLASLNVQLAGWDYETQRLNVFTEVSHAFVDLLAAQKKLTLAQESVNVNEEVRTSVRQRVEAGKDSPVEATKAEVQLSSALTELSKTQQTLEFARKKLALMWGAQEASFHQAKGSFDSIADIPPEDELAELLTQNPDLARWAVEMQQRQAALALEQSNSVPDPSLRGGVQRFREDDETTFVMGLSIPLPLFDRNQGGILEAKYNVLKGRQEHRAVEAYVQAALAKAYRSLAHAYTEATDLRSTIVPGAQATFGATQEGYRSGKWGYLEVLDSQRTLFEARGRLIRVLSDYHKAWATIERLIGQRIITVDQH